MSFYSLPTGKFYKKKEKRKLENFPAGYIGRLYRNLADNVDNFLGSDFYGRTTNDYEIPSADVQKYILTTSHLRREWKVTLTTMWQKIGLIMLALDRS